MSKRERTIERLLIGGLFLAVLAHAWLTGMASQLAPKPSPDIHVSSPVEVPTAFVEDD
jgi:hypothetical protein